MKKGIMVFVGWAVGTLFFMLLAMFYLLIKDLNNAAIALIVTLCLLIINPIIIENLTFR